jgi:CRP/FNR family cyclic AMP-dependent transcriptional regulator
VELAAGETLFREGDTGTSAYQILSGVVRVTVDGATGPTELARRSVGELIGELSILSRDPRSATVTAVEHTRLAVITPDRIERELDTANPLLAKMVRSLSHRLRQAADGARG